MPNPEVISDTKYVFYNDLLIIQILLLGFGDGFSHTEEWKILMYIFILGVKMSVENYFLVMKIRLVKCKIPTYRKKKKPIKSCGSIKSLYQKLRNINFFIDFGKDGFPCLCRL